MTTSRDRWSPVCEAPRGLVRPVRLDPRGLTGPTRGQARSRGWRRSSHGFYVPSWVDRTIPEQRILEQAVRLPKEGAVTGWAACRMFRAGFFDGREPDGVTEVPVPVCLGATAQIRAHDDCAVSRARLGEDEVVVVR